MTETVRTILADAARGLAGAGIEGAPRDARRLVAAALETAPANVTLRLNDPMTAAEQRRFRGMVQRRLERVPVSHILGQREFYGRAFRVTGDVLDPRPETETLVELALAEPFRRVLDLGTGSGILALTLVAERPAATAVATDICADALAVARENPLDEDFSDRVTFRRSNWFDRVGETFDLIVSNPPYIAAGEMPGLAPELAHEPRIALTDEGDGLSAYRRIAAGLPRHLEPGGRVLVEIGPTQAAAVSALFAAAGLENIRVCPDLDGRDRVVGAKKPR